MKTVFYFVALMCITLSPIFAQTTIPNGAFENWQNTGQSSEEPTNWNSNKTGGGVASIGPQTCFRESSNPHGGTYCMRLANANLLGTPINASATTGRIEAPNTNPVNGYINTLTNDPDFNSPFTGRPDSLVGWIKYTSGNGDNGRIQAFLHDNFDVAIPDQGGSASHIIAEATFNTGTSNISGWTRFSVPFVYNNGNAPTHILLIATASAVAGGAQLGSILWVDDLEAIYCTDAFDTLTVSGCNSYTSPSGKVWSMSGTYADTVANGNCDSLLTINLTINTVDTSVTDNGASLKANANNATFQWVDCNNGNAPIAGATNATFTPTTTGSFAVQVTQNGCTVLSTCYNVVLSDVNKIALENAQVYPNPTTGAFTIDLARAYDNVTIRITDIHGKVVQTSNNHQGRLIQLDLEQAAGIYFVQITSDQGQAVVKLVKH